MLLGETTAKLRELARPGNESRLSDVLSDRISHMPPAARTPYQAQVAPFIKSMRFAFAEDVDGQKGLARLTLRVVLERDVAVEVRRLFRPASRPGAGT